MIRISLILFYNLLAFFQLYKVLLTDHDFSEIKINIGVNPKVVAHVSCFLNTPIPGNYSFWVFLSACVSVPLLYPLLSFRLLHFLNLFCWGFFPSVNKSGSYQILLHAVVSKTFCIKTAVCKTRRRWQAGPAVFPWNMDTPKILEGGGGDWIQIMMMKSGISLHKTDIQEGRLLHKRAFRVGLFVGVGFGLVFIVRGFFPHSEWKCL